MTSINRIIKQYKDKKVRLHVNQTNGFTAVVTDLEVEAYVDDIVLRNGDNVITISGHYINRVDNIINDNNYIVYNIYMNNDDSYQLIYKG